MLHLSCISVFHAASVNGTAALGLCYIDDVSVTKMEISPNDATLTDLTFNGTSIESFTASNLVYTMEVPYNVEQILMGGTPNNPSATVVIINPTNLRGYEADSDTPRRWQVSSKPFSQVRFTRQ